jgi:hypothetical protein
MGCGYVGLCGCRRYLRGLWSNRALWSRLNLCVLRVFGSVVPTHNQQRQRLVEPLADRYRRI